jgi:ribosome-associated heat shock protein Hsp15
MEATRIDRWLWAVRLCKTRSAATAACNGGHVDVNGVAAKPATKVKVGDTVTAHLDQRDRVVEVVRIIEKRVGAPTAAECLVDHSPPPPTRDEVIAAVFARDPGAGRPTKRDRRELDRFRRS